MERRRKTNFIWLYVLIGLVLISAGTWVYTQTNFKILFSPAEVSSLHLSQSTYSIGDGIVGEFKFKLRGGELVPKDSDVLVSFGDEEKSFLLSELIDENDLIDDGTFYLENVGEFGSGIGYGLVGGKEIYPNVDFELKIIGREEGNVGGAVSGTSSEVPSEVKDDTVGELPSGGDVSGEQTVITEPEVEVSVGGASGTGEADKESESSTSAESSSDTSVSGDSSSESGSSEGSSSGGESSSDSGDSGESSEPSLSPAENIVSGNVKKGEDFVYELKNDEIAELVAGSVSVDGEQIGESNLDVKTEGGNVIVSTDYSETEKGFGEDYFDLNKEIEKGFGLGQFGFSALEKTETLRVRILFNEKVLFDNGAKVVVGDEVEPEPEAVASQGEVTQEIRLNEPVVWTKEIDAVGPTTVVFEIPEQAVVKSVEKIKSSGEKTIGEVTENVGDEVLFSPGIEFNVELAEGETGAIVYYETPAPEIVSYDETEKGARVVVSAPDIPEHEYENVFVYATIPDEFLGKVDSTRIYWSNEGEFLAVSGVDDYDGDGKLDIAWNAPHLSEQTFEIIFISKAEHLDGNKEFISDIYDSVKELDGIWSETIRDEEFVRVIFEQKLNSNNDVTLYPRVIFGDPKIEIYEINGNEKIAEFDSLNDEQYNKVYLTNLIGEQDSFDLRVIDGELEFEHILDPTDGAPSVDFTSETPENGAQENNDIFVGLETEDMSTHYSFVDFDNSVVLWMKMDEIDVSGNPYDNSSFGNHGTKIGNAVQISSGYFGEGFVLDGNGDYINISVTDSLDLDWNYTTCAWVYPTAMPTYSPIFARGSVTSSQNRLQQYYLYFGSTGALNFGIGDGAFVQTSSTSSGTVVQNTWQFVCAQVNESNQMNIYKNGIDVTSTRATKTRIYTQTATLQGIGVKSGSYFNGIIDEVIVFNRALSLTEINSLYNASANQYHHNFTNLADGEHDFQGFAVDAIGQANKTEQRIVNIGIISDTNPPVVNFVPPTPLNGQSQSNKNIFVNVSTNDESDHYSFVDFDKDVLLWMRMDDTNSSGDLVDLSSYSSNGTSQGNSTQGEGYFGEGFSFDGTGDFIEINKLVASKGNVTYSAWVNADVLKQEGIVEQENDNAGRFVFRIDDSSGHLYFSRGGDYYVSSSTLTGGEWHHIVVSYDGSATFYIDGTKDVPQENSMAIFDRSFNFFIGNGFDGAIDEVIVFNRSLIEKEVLALYNSQSDHFERDFSNLNVGLHKFKAFGVDKVGNLGESEERSVTIFDDVSLPSIDFVPPTPLNASTQEERNAVVNLSTSDASSHYSFVDFDNSLIGWWRLDNDASAGESSSKVFDWSGNGNNGTVQDDAAPTESGRFGGGFNFDGVSDYIEIGDLNAIENLSRFTIGAWAKSSQADLDFARYIVSRASLVHLRKEATERFTFGLNNGSTEVNVYSISIFPGTGWHYVVGVLNGTDVLIYVDGNYENKLPFAGRTNSLTNGFLISGTSETQSWNGTIDEVIIFNRSLSAGEVRSLYDASANQYINNFESLRGGNHSLQGFAVDSSGNMNKTEKRQFEVVGVRTCRTLNEANKIYVLDYDFVGIPPVSGVCFEITANNVTLDGDGHKVTGQGLPGTIGVYSEGRKDLTIKNIAIEGFDYGIYFQGANNSNIENNTFFQSRIHGMYLRFCANNTIQNNLISECGLNGIQVYSGGYNFLKNNVISEITDFGLNLEESHSNLISNNSIKTGQVGVRLFSDSEKNVILNNNLMQNSYGSVGVAGASSVENYLVYNNSHGEIRWTDNSADGFLRSLLVYEDLTFPGNVTISHNFVSLGEPLLSGKINSSANITFYNHPSPGLNEPKIMRNWIYECNATTVPNCQNFTSLSADTVVFSVSSWSNYSIYSNLPPLDPVPVLSSSLGMNRTTENLICSALAIDPEGDNVNYTIKLSASGAGTFIIGGVVPSGSIAGGQVNAASTKKGQTWNCSIKFCDSFEACSNEIGNALLTVLNTLPVVNLTSPLNDSIIFDRSPTFGWIVYDADNDPLFNPTVPNDFSFTYDLNLTCYHTSGGGCAEDDEYIASLGTNQYTTGKELKLIDDGYYHNWSVRARDSEAYGVFSSKWRFDIVSYVNINLTKDVVDFGQMSQLETDDTTDNDPLPFLLENIGNVFVNVTLNASELWFSPKKAGTDYQFKVDVNSLEPNSFNYGASATSWTTMPVGVPDYINRTADLNYSDAFDTCEVDLRIRVPEDEPAGALRSSQITFIASRSI